MGFKNVFQGLTRLFSDGSPSVALNQQTAPQPNTYNLNGNDILFKTNNKDEYEAKLLQGRQQNLLAKQWRRATNELNNKSLASLNEVQLMYRDTELMDAFPEIGTAMDIFAEESCYIGKTGFMVNINSKSERVKSVLEDLLVNRLQINVTLPMVSRAMCKYGNCFMLLDMNAKSGVVNWKQLPVMEMQRFENGMDNPYSSAYSNLNNIDLSTDVSPKFVWVGQNEFIPYRSWQIGHFRLLYDSQFLPYGCSVLNKARRHFRILSMMEDSMLLYRLERSMERRVFKINVGAINPDDVPAYVQEVMNEFKRTPIVDPQTGQLDLRKNIITQQDDYFVPVRDSSEPSPIETLQGAQNLTAMDDIKYIQNKIVTALRIPKQFLNFEETTGDGKNLSLLDVRFMRTVNRIQQALLMELNKICIIHLYMLGFEDDLTNFSLTMNNPSTQAEMMELDNLAKKITTAKDAVSDLGNGIALMSLTRAWREILGWSDKEIADNLEQMRLEAALAIEIQKTSQIIKRTGLFDPVDNVYGEAGADYSEENMEGEGSKGGPGGGFGGGFGGGGLGGGFGADMDFGDEEGLEGGAEGEMPMGDAAAEEGEAAQEGEIPPMGEAYLNNLLRKTLNEQKMLKERLLKENMDKQEKYLRKLTEHRNEIRNENEPKPVPIFQKNFLINQELNEMVNHMKEISADKVDNPFEG